MAPGHVDRWWIYFGTIAPRKIEFAPGKLTIRLALPGAAFHAETHVDPIGRASPRSRRAGEANCRRDCFGRHSGKNGTAGSILLFALTVFFARKTPRLSSLPRGSIAAAVVEHETPIAPSASSRRRFVCSGVWCHQPPRDKTFSSDACVQLGADRSLRCSAACSGERIDHPGS
jgi:hypothetical protein